MNTKQLFEQRFYKEVTAKYQKAMKEIEEMKERGELKKSVVIDRSIELSEELQEEFANGYMELEKSLADQRLRLKEKYSKEVKYSNPQEMVLKRQDFEMNLQIMNESEMIQFVNEFVKRDEIMPFEFGMVKLHLKEKDINNVTLNMKLMMLEKEKSIGKTWETDPKWKSGEELSTQMQQMRSSLLWVKDNNQKYAPLNIQSALMTSASQYT